jgi:hypothetical protein
MPRALILLPDRDTICETVATTGFTVCARLFSEAASRLRRVGHVADGVALHFELTHDGIVVDAPNEVIDRLLAAEVAVMVEG